MELDTSGIHVSDFVEPGTYVTPAGDVIGTIKYAEGMDALFSGDESEGHFFPTVFGNDLESDTLTIKGRKNGDRQVTLDEDRSLVIRLENLAGNTATIESNEKEVVTFNFGTATLIPEEYPKGRAAFNPDKKDYGGFGKNELYYEGGKVRISWDGIKATVSGTLKWVKQNQATKLPSDGNYFAFALSGWFKDKKITVDNGGKVKTSEETDWVCSIGKEKKEITVKYKDYVIAIFDLSNVKLIGEQD